jgi:hypothetical protein
MLKSIDTVIVDVTKNQVFLINNVRLIGRQTGVLDLVKDLGHPVIRSSWSSWVW